MRRRPFLVSSSLAMLGASGSAAAETLRANPEKVLPLPGRLFEVASRQAFVIEPVKPATATRKPWVWYAPTLKPYPGPEEKRMIERFLEAGISIAGIDVGESYGSPSGVKLYEQFYDFMTGQSGFSPKPGLLARSRGGLMLYNWASKHPDQVACIAGIYPVCDPSSWPGLEKAAPAYGMPPERLKDELAKYNPVDNLEPLAKARVPIFHIHGDSDTVVPLDRNSGKVAERYEKLGGSMRLVVPSGQGHNMWKGFFECEELIAFVIGHLAGKPAKSS